MKHTPLPQKSRPLGSLRPSILIEGWRGINHSFAIVNQSQILELLKLDGVRLYHRDLPFAFPNWNRAQNGSGLTAEDQGLIDALGAPPEGQKVDCVYRIGSPFRAGAKNDRRKTVTFMITELGLCKASFDAGVTDRKFFTRSENWIATGSSWARDRLADWGFDAGRIAVIPHGVDRTIFHPLSEAERAHNRAALGIGDDATVFLNIGLSSWNKGVDLLLAAFAQLRSAGRNVRLILKDQKDLYGRSVQTMIRDLGASHPTLLAADTLGAISVISNNMSRAELRLLYGIADAYVSPYRAEGFNLPVLEAIACGTPVVVTRGGATDDFCTDEVALRIGGTLNAMNDAETGLKGRYIEPSLSELIEAMDAFVGGRRGGLGEIEATSQALAGRFSWHNAARQLADLAVGLPFAPVAEEPARPAPVTAPPRTIGQKDLLDLIALMRPLAMADTTKVRIGNDYDGGYVLPAQALDCDAVLSIGVGPDVSFDIALAQRGARIAQFDHTVEKPPSDHALCTFYKLGWGRTTGGDLLGFDDILARFDELGGRRAMLKFDIEGAEYQVLDGLDPEALRRFEVIVCEFHDFQRLLEPAFFEAAERSLSVLGRFHAPMHLHANNYAPVTMVAGIAIPNVVEISYLRRDLDSFPGPSREPIPGPLDRPNHPYRVDICMNAF